MKTTTQLILFFFIIGFTGCDEGNENTRLNDLNGDLINTTTCKRDFKSLSVSAIPDTVSCIEYTYDNSLNKLTIKHINSGFNCCPDSLYCEVSLNVDTIIIEEFEAATLCRCNCLYDLDIELDGVISKKYFIRFIEPYVGDQEELFSEIDLTQNMNGSFSVVRKIYPWGEFSLHNEYN